MILKILDKLKFLKKINRNLAKLIFTFIIYADDIFLNIRIFLISIFLSKNNKVKIALNDLKENGVAVVKNLYSDDEINNIKKECNVLLDKIPVDKAQNINYIEAEPIKIEETTIYLEKLGKSLKIKGINELNSFFKKISRKIELSLITLIYQLSVNKPYIIYNVCNDGTTTNPILKDYSESTSDEAIAGRPHIDLFIHQIRCFVALGDVSEQNGATLYYRKTKQSEKILKKNYINMFLKHFEFEADKNQTNYVDHEKLEQLSKIKDKTYLECKKGDLALIDLKTVHYGNLPKKNERHLLWFYY